MATQKERRNKRKENAEARLKKYNNLSLHEKLELARSRRGKSKKEEAKILKIIKEKKQ